MAAAMARVSSAERAETSDASRRPSQYESDSSMRERIECSGHLCPSLLPASKSAAYATRPLGQLRTKVGIADDARERSRQGGTVIHRHDEPGLVIHELGDGARHCGYHGNSASQRLGDCHAVRFLPRGQDEHIRAVETCVQRIIVEIAGERDTVRQPEPVDGGTYALGRP